MLTENHQRYLLATFRHLDGLLSEAADKLGAAGSERLFPPYRMDATPTQQKILRDHLEQLRFVLKRFMDRHGIEVPEPPVSALWSFQTSLTFARIAAHELRPEYLRGYGELAAADGEEILRLIAEINTVLHRIGGYLRDGEGGELDARLARLAQTHDEVALLQVLARIVDRQGLVEFRETLNGLTSRLESPRYDIAFFGHVSAGKSSLLNFIVDREVLPIGVTPVTSAVTRLCYGEAARLRVTFATEPMLDTAIDEVADFVTEERNPANGKHVVDVTLELPVPLLHSGAHLIDTPGLGTLATAGAAQTLAYLPRCDLGVMLIDGGSLGRDDLAVARYVIEAGGELIILLSKADLISASDCETLVRYVRQQFRDKLGMDVTVTPISTAPTGHGLARAWVETELAPRLQRIREVASASLRRKIAVLREMVIATLQARSDAASDSGHRADAAQPHAGGLAQVRADLEATRRDLDQAALALADNTDTLIDAAAVAMTRAARENGDLITRAQSEVVETLQSVAEAMHDRLRRLRDAADAALGAVRAGSGGQSKTDEPLPLPAERPLFDSGVLKSNAPLPAFHWTLGLPALRRIAFIRALRQRWQPALHEYLAAYAAALRNWSSRYLKQLAHDFDVGAAPFESRWRAAAPAAGGESHGEARAIAEDLRRLVEWPPGRQGKVD